MNFDIRRNNLTSYLEAYTDPDADGDVYLLGRWFRHRAAARGAIVRWRRFGRQQPFYRVQPEPYVSTTPLNDARFVNGTPGGYGNV
jgi:hypothetical protein